MNLESWCFTPVRTGPMLEAMLPLEAVPLKDLTHHGHGLARREDAPINRDHRAARLEHGRDLLPEWREPLTQWPRRSHRFDLHPGPHLPDDGRDLRPPLADPRVIPRRHEGPVGLRHPPPD